MRFLFSLLILFACGPSRPAAGDESWALAPIVKLDEHNPVLTPEWKSEFFCPINGRNIRWEEKDVFNPAAVVADKRIWLLYRAQDRVGWPAGTSRIGIAQSKDGLKFKREPQPVLYPNNDDQKYLEWSGGCEDPRIVRRSDGLFVMTYTAYDGKIARLCTASSRDLFRWQKHGPVLSDPKYRNTWSKSGAIVAERSDDDIVAKQIDGKYWMYWGDTDLFMAVSTDLLLWEPVEDKKGELLRVMQPRPGFFDSKLVEPGPFALWRKEGVLLLYNSANSPSNGDKSLPGDSYAVGQALFSRKDPRKLIARANNHFMHPDKDYELSGQVNNVCFLEGMVWYKGRWLLYYGTADSKIAVAECGKK